MKGAIKAVTMILFLIGLPIGVIIAGLSAGAVVGFGYASRSIGAGKAPPTA